MKIKPLIIVMVALLGFYSCQDETAVTDFDPRDEITLQWSVEEYSDKFGEQYFTCTIEKDSFYENRVILKNFANLGEHIETEGYLYGDSIQLPYQEPDGNPLKGYGIVSSNGNIIDFDYYVNFGSGKTEFEATFHDGPIAALKDSLIAAKGKSGKH